MKEDLDFNRQWTCMPNESPILGLYIIEKSNFLMFSVSVGGYKSIHCSHRRLHFNIQLEFLVFIFVY